MSDSGQVRAEETAKIEGADAGDSVDAGDGAAVVEEAERAEETVKPEAGTRPYDIDYPEKFKEFMRTGWRDTALDVVVRSEAPNHAKRRAQLSAAFPGETLVIPSGREKVRANDTLYLFRPGSDFTWLTGEHDPDAVLIMRPNGGGHDATLYIRPRSPRDTDEFFRNAVYGELWIGRRHTLAEKATELEIDTESLTNLEEALASCAPGRTRVLRGYDHDGRRGGPAVRRRRAPTSVRGTRSSRRNCPSFASSRTNGRSRSFRTRSTRRFWASRTWPGCCRRTAR